jgi:tubulin-like protein
MQKTLIVGLGGTGLAAIRELRRLIAERYDGGLRDPAMASVRFLYIDTEREDESVRGLNWNVLGKDISLRDGEKVKITGDQLGPIVTNVADYDDFRPWLPSVKDFIGDPGPGAKGIRPYGRLIYEYKANKEAVQAACLRAYNELNNEFRALTSWRY